LISFSAGKHLSQLIVNHLNDLI